MAIQFFCFINEFGLKKEEMKKIFDTLENLLGEDEEKEKSPKKIYNTITANFEGKMREFAMFVYGLEKGYRLGQKDIDLDE